MSFPTDLGTRFSILRVEMFRWDTHFSVVSPEACSRNEGDQGCSKIQSAISTNLDVCMMTGKTATALK